MMSLLPPGENGTISLIGRSGHAACALIGASNNAKAPANSAAQRVERFKKLTWPPGVMSELQLS